ncbi:MAG: hypothetical protein KJZ92_14080 [Rhodocyclaceae bacterium]|nr:hypothetical protein [Rhodocyclaceae bacterium]
MIAPATPQTQASPAASLAAIDSVLADIDRRYFDLGWDFGSFFGIDLPEGAPREMRQGWEQGRRRLNQRVPTRFERKWLALRFNALRRNRVVDPAVTAGYIQKIMLGYCPVLGARLTCATGGEMDWSVDRVFNNGAYAPANICVMSVKANQAKGGKLLPDVLATARQAQGANQPIDGLTAREWMRLAALMVGPHCLATGETYLLPQATYVPPDLAATPEQLLQEAILLDALGMADGHVVGRLRAHCAGKSERQLHKLVQALRRKDKRNRWTSDVWFEPGVFDRFRDWWRGLSEAQLRLMCDLALKAEFRGATSLSREEAGNWALLTGGYALRH